MAEAAPTALSVPTSTPFEAPQKAAHKRRKHNQLDERPLDSGRRRVCKMPSRFVAG
eukprot:CAMPEP_0119076798 /NCGR_PEP_ID=MMETSP1178-20130426/89826_1 /TAXON_ID=33656 /ORGANISM="unid sp, Strain CCMP2000" /LENGTH=55 /DNA_ID=CAMNT_0007059111 /DNA_START=8 /DNA_END=171 /DNA_ORIENTATION=-